MELHASSATRWPDILDEPGEAKTADHSDSFSMPNEDFPSSNTTTRRSQSMSTMSTSLLSRPAGPCERISLHVDVSLRRSVPIPEVASLWESEMTYGDCLNSDLMSSTETSLLDSTDSTLVNSPRWKDDLFGQCIRSPSPESERILEDKPFREYGGATNSSAPPTSADARKESRGLQRTHQPPKGLNKVSIRLRPLPVQSKTKIVLRCLARKRRQRQRQVQRRGRKSEL